MSELQNKIRVLEQDLASAKCELQGKARYSRSTHFQMINQVIQVVSSNVLDTVWSWIEPAAKTITLYSNKRIRPRYIK